MKSKERSLLLLGVAAALAICSCIPTAARADVITDWNARTVQYSAAGGRPGPTWVLDVAVVQLAVFDAVQALEGDYQSYCGTIPDASGSIVAAAATAARDVLVDRFPAQSAAINSDYEQYVMSIDPNDPGFGVGSAAGACVNNMRAGDGSFPIGYPAFTGGTLPGEWRPVASGPWTFAWLPDVTPFTMRSATQFRAGPPPRLTSPEYTRAFNEVKAYGSATGSARSPEQTDMAHFWNGNFPGQMNKLARDLGTAQGLSVSENSRLLALVTVSVADSAIAAWDCKREYNFWRPITAIRLGEDDSNPRTAGDASWTPLIPTPPYSDHTSGANNFVAAATRAMQLYFDTNEMHFTITTTNPGPTQLDVRTFHKFSEVRDEVEDARILQGIHFRFADSDARRQGEHIAQWVHSHYFRPVE